jgi:multicomponent Na+:H+ antiporter subunit G
MSVNDVIVIVSMLLGTAIMLLGSFGVLRFGDVFLRMHAATKSSTLGIGFILIGVIFYFADAFITIKLIALAALFFLTVPIGAQTLAHAAHLAGVPLVKETWIDELEDAHSSYWEEGEH